VNAKGYRDSTATRNKPSGRAVEFPMARVSVEPEESVALITNKGRLWKGNAGRIKLQTTFSEFGLGKDERVIGAGALKPDHKVVLVTRSGNVKRITIEDLNGRTEGNWAQVIGLEGDHDEVVLGGLASEQAEVLVATSGSEKTTPRVLRFEAKSVNPQVSPTAKGVAAIKMLDDAIIGGALVEPAVAKKGFALLVTENGHIKRITLAEFPVQGRGGQGVQTWKLTKNTGLINGVAVTASESGDVDVFSAKGRRLRLAVKDIPLVTRAAKGAVITDVIKSSELFGSEPVAGIVTG
jgi:DNA gyrase subunit A